MLYETVGRGDEAPGLLDLPGRRMAGHENDRQRRVDRANGSKDLDAGHPRHADIQEDHVRPLDADGRETVPSVMAYYRLVAGILEGAGKEGGDLLVILHHYDSNDWSSR